MKPVRLSSLVSLLALALVSSSCNPASTQSTGHQARVKEQIRLALEWVILDEEPGSFILFESRGHEGWIQMLLADEKHVEFDFPLTIRLAPGQPQPLYYEPVSALPDIPDAEEQNPFTEEQVTRLQAVLKTYHLSPYIVREASKNTNGAIVGAIESLTFRVPISSADKIENLLPELFAAVHGIEAITTLDIQTGNNR
jgi:hypothetical protein